MQVYLITEVCPCAGSVGSTQHTLLTFRLDETRGGPPSSSSHLTDEEAEGKSFALGHTAPALVELDQGLGFLTPWISEWVSLTL